MSTIMRYSINPADAGAYLHGLNDDAGHNYLHGQAGLMLVSAAGRAVSDDSALHQMSYEPASGGPAIGYMSIKTYIRPAGGVGVFSRGFGYGDSLQAIWVGTTVTLRKATGVYTVFTTLATATVPAFVAGDKLGIKDDGVNVSVYINDLQVIAPVAQGSFQSGAPGAGWFEVAAGTAGQLSIDEIDFSTDVPSLGGPYSASFLGQTLNDAGLGALCDGGMVLEFRDGAQPANTSVAATGNVLARVVGRDVGFIDYTATGFPTTGVSNLTPPLPVVGLMAGTPTWVRAYRPNGTTVLFDKPCGVGDAFAFNLNAPTIAVGQRLQLECLVVRDPSGAVTGATTILAQVAIGGAMAGGIAELPRVYYDTTEVAQTGASLTVGSGKLYADPLLAYAAATWGDHVVIDAGFDWTPSGGAGAAFGFKAADVAPTHRYITIRGAAAPCGPLARTSPALSAAANIPKFRLDNSGGALSTGPGAHHLRFVGIEVLPKASAPPATPFSLINISPNTGPQGQGNTYADMPHHIILDRVYAHGATGCDIIHGVLIQGEWLAVINSHISELHNDFNDCTGIHSWMGKGPLKIVNNHVEALTENVMIGGAQSLWPGVVPGDIEIRYNTIAKDPAWHGVWGRLKTLLEMKGGKRCQIEGNHFLNNWEGTANWFGPCVTLKTTSEGGNNTLGHWRTCDVTVRYNWFENVANCVNFASLPAKDPSTPCTRIYIGFNLGSNLNTIPGVTFPNRAYALAFSSDQRVPMRDVLAEHNTFVYPLGGGAAVNTGDNDVPVDNVKVRDNVFAGTGQFPVQGAGAGYTDQNLAAFWGATSDFAHNVVEGYDFQPFEQLPSSPRGANNHAHINRTDLQYPYIGFKDLAGGDFSLAPVRADSSANPHTGYATDGTNPGYDRAALLAALGLTDSPPPSEPPPTPAPGAAIVALVVVRAPSAAKARQPFTVQPIVKAVLADGSTATSFTGLVTAFKRGGRGTLRGTLTMRAVAGVASWTDLQSTLSAPILIGFYTLEVDV
jgi:hypothetical protein